MRIAVTIAAGSFALAISVQTWTGHAGALGWLIAFLYLMGALVTYRRPGWTVAALGLAAVASLGYVVGHRGEVDTLWGIAASIICAMSAIAWREQQRTVRRQLVHRLIDEELVPFDVLPPSRSGNAHLQEPTGSARGTTPRQ
ncbi:MAG TPA: hypothetical protein VH482_24980 [Thermomicrobiales bacterium]|jgi:hypothetical protein